MQQAACVLLLSGAVLLAGCGAETVGTAATAAAVKQKEAEEGRKTMERMKQKIGAAAEQTQQRAEKGGDQ